MSIFKGAFVAIVTPFIDGQLDEQGLVDLIEFHIENGTHGIVLDQVYCLFIQYTPIPLILFGKTSPKQRYSRLISHPVALREALLQVTLRHTAMGARRGAPLQAMRTLWSAPRRAIDVRPRAVNRSYLKSSIAQRSRPPGCR